MERVSIVIPTYNHAHFLPQSIESAFAQTRPADEIIVIDNGSVDDTPRVARSYPVRYVRQTNQGICGSTNRGIVEATGRYLVILHSDDRLLPRHVEAGLDAFRAHPEAGFVCGDYRWFGAPDTWHRHRCAPQPDHYATLLRSNFIGPPVVVMFRQDVLRAVGGFRREFEGADDQDMYLRIARQYPIYCHHEVVAEYRRHEGQNSQRLGFMLAAALRVMQAQRPYVDGRPEYEQAWKEGVRQRRSLYSETIFWQGVRAAKTGQWGAAWSCLATLMKYDRSAVLHPAYRRLLGAVRRPVPASPPDVRTR
ncbi:glycosyltransferase [Candidatus Nitrospira bockiana]